MEKGYEKKYQKSPLFRKNSNTPPLDLNNILFGVENQMNNANAITDNSNNAQELRVNSTTIPKPPLPKAKTEQRSPTQSLSQQQQIKQNTIL